MSNLVFLIIAVLFGLSLALTLTYFERSYDVPQVLCLISLIFILWIRTGTNELGIRSGLVALIAFFAFSWLLPAVPFAIAMALCLIAAYFGFQELTNAERRKLKSVLIFVATIESVFAVASYSNLNIFFLRDLNGAPVGTIGNPDFLASVIAAGIFTAASFLKEKPGQTYVILGILIAGLVATKSRGTIGIVAILLLWRFLPRWCVTFSGLCVAAGVAFFWEKFVGRIQLWWTCLLAIKEKPWSGFGLNQVDSVYFNKNLELMNADPEFRSFFGPWSSQITDAHNLLLQWGVEFGVVGIAMAIAAWVFVLTQANRKTSIDDRNLLIMMTLKSVYTVVLISVQNVALLAFALSDKEEVNQILKPSPLRLARLMACGIIIAIAMKSFIVAASNSADLKIAMTFLRVGMPELAMPAIDRILVNSPTETDAILAKSFAFDRQGKCSQSSLYALRAVEARQNMDVFKRAGHILFECRFYSEALEIFKDLHTVFPEHRTTTMKMAWAYYYLGEFALAERYVRQMISSSPRRKSFSDERNLREASELLDKVRQTKPGIEEMRAGGGS